MEGPAARRPRRRDARANDTRILDAALGLAATQGWAGLGLPTLARASGLSLPPVRERFADRTDVASALWRERIEVPFATAINRVCQAADDFGGDATAMKSAYQRLAAADDAMRAAGELIIVALYNSELAEVISRTWQPLADRWMRPGVNGVDAASAARRAYAVAVGLGIIIFARGIPVAMGDITAPTERMVRALSARGSAIPLPAVTAEYLDMGASFDVTDPAHRALLQATLDVVGTKGYDAATLELIARESGYSKGIIQNRYSNKKHLFLDATKRMLAAATLLNEDFLRKVSSDHSAGVAEAALIREFMASHRRLIRSISFEQLRMAWHDGEIALMMKNEFDVARRGITASETGNHPALDPGNFTFGLATGQGVALLADLDPLAARLPFDVVSVPMAELAVT